MPKTRQLPLPPIWKSLSARLLVLTVFFVMLVELFVYAPSVARYRLVYLQDKMANAQLAISTLQTTEGQRITQVLQDRLLTHARAHMIMLRAPGQPKYAIMRELPSKIDATFDLREETFFGLIADAFETLVNGGDRTLRVRGPSPTNPEALIEIVISEKPLYNELVDYSWRILGLSILISLVTAALVYASLHLILVRPLRGLTENMIHYRADPADPNRFLYPGRREDEMGVAQQEYAAMQEQVSISLRRRDRLAVLGGAVTRINHDLRNMLGSAQLVSDRLTHVQDPEVQRVAPRLVRAIDRAVDLCTRTLAYAGRDIDLLHRETFALAPLMDEVFADEEVRAEGRTLKHSIDPDLTVRADRGQIYRVLINLVHNAAKAGATTITAAATSADNEVIIDMRDNGPGIPKDLRNGLFVAFHQSERSNGGSGLGLAISREIIVAHGGRISLEDSETGAHFRIRLPRG